MVIVVSISFLYSVLPGRIKFQGNSRVKKNGGVLVVAFRGCNRALLLTVLSLERSIEGASVVSLRVLSRKTYHGTEDDVLS